MADNQITLDVSGRKFRTSKSVLSVSPYFRNLFDRWADGADHQADGSYSVDADANTFEHLLSFMRRPSRFPLYWTKEDGFDYALYNSVEADADFFMLEGLRDWIKQRKYLEAVSVVVRTGSAAKEQRLDGDVVIEKYVNRRGGFILCPLALHQDPENGCWRNDKCQKAMTANGLQMSGARDDLLVAVTEFHFNNEILVNDTKSH